MSTANHLTKNAYLGVRDTIARYIASAGVPMTAARAAAESLIEEEFIDVQVVASLP